MTSEVQQELERTASAIINCKQQTIMWDRLFRAHFGISITVCASLWVMLTDHGLPAGSNMSHCLWTLFFLKNYVCEDVACSRFKTTPKTFRKWVWIFIEAIGQLPLVCNYL
jgi:hypothetical protein